MAISRNNHQRNHHVQMMIAGLIVSIVSGFLALVFLFCDRARGEPMWRVR